MSTISRKHAKLLQKIYYNEAMYLGRDRLFYYLTKEYPNDHPTRQQVMQWLKGQKVHQIHTRPVPRLPTKSVVVSKPKSYYQCDLTGPLSRDSGYNYIFGLIDVATKELFTSPLKNKTALETSKGLSRIIDDNDLEISVIQSDNGSEFSGEFSAFAKNAGIKLIFSQASSPWTNGNIERVWGTLKQMLYRYQTATGTKSWVKILPTLTDNYNRTIHRSIGTTPEDAAELPRAELKKRLQSNAVKIVEPKQVFQVGDKIRLRIKESSKLEKAKQYFTNGIYKINGIIKGSKSKVTEYTLENVRGTFNATDLLLANVAQLPPKEVKKPANYRAPLPIRAQVEVDRLLENRNLRPRPVRRNEYIVEKILDTRIHEHRREYLVKWSGYEEPTWQDESDLTGAPEALKAFLKGKRLVYVLV